MYFTIIIHHNFKRYKITVEQVYAGASLEHFKLYPPDNPGKYIIVTSDRPLWLSKSLPHHRINWKLKDGEVHNRSTFEEAIKAIEHYLKNFGYDPNLYKKK